MVGVNDMLGWKIMCLMRALSGPLFFLQYVYSKITFCCLCFCVDKLQLMVFVCVWVFVLVFFYDFQFLSNNKQQPSQTVRCIYNLHHKLQKVGLLYRG